MCDECGHALILDKRAYLDADVLICEHCGADLTDAMYIEPVKCGYSGAWCAYPCGKSKRGPSDDGTFCHNHTPVKECRLASERFDFSKARQLKRAEAAR